MSRVALSKIRSLTLFKGKLTKTRRLPPVQQLSCIGKACNLYQPEVVRCYNEGGEGTEIDWVCRADLPEKLRFGRIDVSCEGWDHPGDPFVLKGSCGLEYRLVHVDGEPRWNTRDLLSVKTILTASIYVLLGSFLLLALFTLLEPCFERYILPHFGSRRAPRPPPPAPPRPGGWFNTHSNDGPPPPPYSAAPPPAPKPRPSTSSPQSSGNTGAFGNIQSGFWTGLGLGGLGAAMAQRVFRRDDERLRQPPRPAREYDWERERLRAPGSGISSSFPNFASSSSSAAPPAGSARSRRSGNEASGSSSLGPTRRSTGYATSNVR